MMTERYYTEEEVGEIIRRAIQSQNSEGTQAGQQEKAGISMEELIEIGNEIGLSEDVLKKAALDHSIHELSHSRANDTHIFKEMEFNTKLPPDMIWEEVLAELSHHFSNNEALGQIREHPRKFEWTHTSISGIDTVVTLVMRGEKAKIRLSQRVGLGSPVTEGIVYGGVLSVALIGIAYAILSPGLVNTLAMGTTLWGLSSLLVYKLDVAWRKKKLRNLKSLGSRIINGLHSGLDEGSHSTAAKTGTSKTVKADSQIFGREKEIEIEEPEHSMGNDTGTGNSTEKRIRSK